MTITHSKTTRYLALWTFRGRRSPIGKMHLAQAKTTSQIVTRSWCGRTLFPASPPVHVTGEEAFLNHLSDPDEGTPTCLRCLDAIGAWGWYEERT